MNQRALSHHNPQMHQWHTVLQERTAQSGIDLVNQSAASIKEIIASADRLRTEAQPQLRWLRLTSTEGIEMLVLDQRPEQEEEQHIHTTSSFRSHA